MKTVGVPAAGGSVAPWREQEDQLSNTINSLGSVLMYDLGFHVVYWFRFTIIVDSVYVE